MDIDDLLPNGPNDPVMALVRQDIDRLSVDELDTRIATLKAEIERCRQRKTYAVNHRASADSLFKR